MNKYRVKIFTSDKVKIINANSELEAKVKFCEEQGFNYRTFANKLEVIKENRKKTERKKERKIEFKFF